MTLRITNFYKRSINRYLQPQFKCSHLRNGQFQSIKHYYCLRISHSMFSSVEFMRFFHYSTPYFKTIPSNRIKGSSSQEWLTRQLNDPYVKKAKEMNYRARSAFKLLEMDDKLKILKHGMVVVECGAAPGAWSQIAVDRINANQKDPTKPVGKLVGIDLLPIAPLPGATFLSFCDFTTPETQLKIQKILYGENQQGETKRIVDLVLSDMAPNASGIHDMDNARICSLVRAGLEFALEFGKPGSHFLAKIWAGSEMKSLERDILQYYKSVQPVKPKSSREDSSEIFIFAKSMKKLVGSMAVNSLLSNFVCH